MTGNSGDAGLTYTSPATLLLIGLGSLHLHAHVEAQNHHEGTIGKPRARREQHGDDNCRGADTVQSGNIPAMIASRTGRLQLHGDAQPLEGSTTLLWVPRSSQIGDKA